MRTILLFLLAGLVVMSTACDGDDDPGTRLTMTPLRYTVPAGLNPVLAHNLALSNISTEQARFDQETGVPWEDWARVVPARASLVIQEPGLDWGFAQEVTLRAFTDDPDRATELFYRDQIPLNVGPQLDMIPSDFDAKPLLDNPDIGLILELRRLRNSPPQSIPVTLQWSFSGIR